MKITVRYLRQELPHFSGVVVSPRNKWLWLKPCRTGGTSIWRDGLMGQYWINGGTQYQPDEYRAWLDRVTDAELEQYFVWTIVRNPYDRFVSALAYLHVEVEDFCADPVSNLWHTVRIHALPQFWYYECADYVGRYETLTDNYREVCERINQNPISLPRMNTSDRRPYRDALAGRGRETVEWLYARELEELAYEW